MTAKAKTEKWMSVLLGIVCLALVFNLFRGSRARTAGSATPADAQGLTAPSGAGARNPADDLARYDPAIHEEVFREILDRPEPKQGRDPFDFVVHQAPAVVRTSGPAPAPVPREPPPPPLKAVGYSEKGDGVREAIVTLQDELFIVHEGETFAKRFQVVRISPTQVEVSDASTQQNIRLPIAQ